MRIVKSETLTASQKEDIVKIWNAEYPVSLSYDSVKGFDDYLSKLTDIHHFFILDNLSVIAWMCVFTRDEERWFAMIINSSHQKKGLGKQLLQTAKKEYNLLNGWVVDKESYLKENGLPYISPLQFYFKNDFEIIKDSRLEMPHLSAVRVRWQKP